MAVYTTINDPSAYFQTALYNGSSSSVTVTNDGNSNLQPDWLWFKRRSGTASDHNVFDTSRGLTERIFPNLSSASDTTNPNGITSLTDGFTTGTSYGNVNGNGETFVTWQWKANAGTTSSNTDGSITSTVQANTTAGFSIVTYNGEGDSQATVGHGLGVKPQVIIPKNRGAIGNWHMYHEGVDSSAPEDYGLLLNSTNARADDPGFYNDTAPTSSVFTVGTYNNFNYDYVAYCFAEKQGYSKFGSYIGNGSTNGPFIYTGFKPAFVLIKNTAIVSSWILFDNKRSSSGGYNVNGYSLKPNSSNAEDTSAGNKLDLLSNGFKIRSDGLYEDTNDSGVNLIYMAFAESPFTTSDGVPTTAR